MDVTAFRFFERSSFSNPLFQHAHHPTKFQSPSCRKYTIGDYSSQNSKRKPWSLLIHTTRDSKVGSRYKKMAFDACGNFVGPMSVEDFLSEFVPSNKKESRPKVEISYDHSVPVREGICKYRHHAHR